VELRSATTSSFPILTILYEYHVAWHAKMREIKCPQLSICRPRAFTHSGSSINLFSNHGKAENDRAAYSASSCLLRLVASCSAVVAVRRLWCPLRIYLRRNVEQAASNDETIMYVEPARKPTHRPFRPARVHEIWCTRDKSDGTNEYLEML
jgi:hypothetical protein